MRQEIQNKGVHTGEIILEEIQVGDSVVFSTIGESEKDKKIFTVGWEPITSLNREAAEVQIMREHPRSIFNDKGGSSSGLFPEKLGQWEIGFGVVLETPLAMPHEEYVVVLCRSSKQKYTLLRSRETRPSNRFS